MLLFGLAAICFITVSVSAQSQSKKVNSDKVQKKMKTLKKFEGISTTQKAADAADKKTEQVDVKVKKGQTPNTKAVNPNKEYQQRENAKELSKTQIKVQKTSSGVKSPASKANTSKLSEQKKAELAAKRAERLEERRSALNVKKVDAKSKIKKLNK